MAASKIRVAILGGTGLVGRACAAALTAEGEALGSRFELVKIAGSASSTGKRYGEVWETKERELCDHYGHGFWRPLPCPPHLAALPVVPFDELLRSRDVDVVLSSIPGRAGRMEDQLLEHGHRVFSNSPYRRYEPDVPLTVAEVNGHELAPGSRYVKSPNCVTNGVSLVLRPVLDHFGIESVTLTTYQSLSGRGDLKYDLDLVDRNVYPLGRTEENVENYIRMEIQKIYRAAPPFPISVSCQRVFVQRNHFVDVRIRTRRKGLALEEVVAAWRDFAPFAGHADGLVTTPSHPIRVETDAGLPRPQSCDFAENGMSVVVGNVHVDDPVYDIRCSVVVDNVNRGAYGGQLQNVEFLMVHLADEKNHSSQQLSQQRTQQQPSSPIPPQSIPTTVYANGSSPAINGTGRQRFVHCT